MDSDFSARVSRDLGIPRDVIERYNRLFDDRIKPKIKTKFLSHLVTTIEDLINEKKLKDVLEIIRENKYDPQMIKTLYNNRTVRFYSIVLIPIHLKRRATTRYHHFGASVFYNSCYDDKQIRLLIAHELGHIINKELISIGDTEQTANLFAVIAMDDKNKFYTEECRQYRFSSDLEILNEILNVCPVSPMSR